MGLPRSLLLEFASLFPGSEVLSPSIPVPSEKVDPLTYLTVKPQPGKQTHAFESKADIVIYGGSAGSGKSLVLLLKALSGTVYPGYVATIFRRTSQDVTAKGSLWDKSLSLYTTIAGARYRESKAYLDWRFNNGSSISFAHADNLFSTKLGSEMAFIGVDEIAMEWTEKEFLFLVSRNRSNCGIQPQLIGTCNPDCNSFLIKNSETDEWKKGTWLDWWIDEEGYPIPERSGIVRYFYRYKQELLWADSKEELLSAYPFIADQIYQESGVDVDDLIKSFTFISANIYDNPEFLKVNPQYLGNLLMLDEADKLRFLGGNWKVSSRVGVLFNPAWFPIVDEIPPGYDFAFWDFASTAKEVATKQSYYSARAKWRYRPLKDGNFEIYILDILWVQEDPETNDDTVCRVAREDTRNTILGWEIEGGSAGDRYTNALSKRLKTAVPGIQLKAQKPLGDKYTRAKGWADKAKPSDREDPKYQVFLRRGAWNSTFVNALIEFDGTRKPLVNDIIDACSGCNVLIELLHGKGRSKAKAGDPKFARAKDFSKNRR